MKKLIALMLSLLMMILIFASCDTGREELSGEPVSEASSVEVSSEEESQIAEINISLSEEDQEYYNNFLITQLSIGNYDGLENKSPLELLRMFSFMIRTDQGIYAKTFDPISKTTAWEEKHAFQISQIEQVLKTYFGDYTFVDMWETVDDEYATYNADRKAIEMVGAQFTVGGLEGMFEITLPIERQDDIVTIYYPVTDVYRTRIVKGSVVIIQEFEDGFHILKIAELTEDEIADLNEQYFGEK